jgi:aminopeptidase
MLDKYAKLLAEYCLYVKKGERFLIRSTSLASPLLQPLYKEILSRGGFAEFQISFENQSKLFYDYADDQLDYQSELYTHAISNFDGVLNIIAPFDLNETSECSSEKKKRHQMAMKDVKKTFMTRSAKGDLKWSLCVYPTESAAKQCDMSLKEYQDFVFKACCLTQESPIDAWKALGIMQQGIVDHLNTCTTIQYKAPHLDITFSTKGRVWMNSDGKRNMPSGEVFTSPVEESVNGHITFTYPTIYDGQDVENITLVVKDGIIQTWKADIGQDVLDRVFSIEGTRQFGEVAIGTNMNIQRVTKNILFDEKIGGTIHMAIGASYPETGGKNESAVHWDMITDMTKGEILADSKVIYRNGRFTI